MHRPRLFYAPFLSFLISTAFPSSAQSTANPALDTLLETSFGLGGAARLRLSPINTLSSNGHNPQLGSAFLRMGIDPGAFRKRKPVSMEPTYGSGSCISNALSAPGPPIP